VEWWTKRESKDVKRREEIRRGRKGWSGEKENGVVSGEKIV
jgi:hypothetical protein